MRLKSFQKTRHLEPAGIQHRYTPLRNDLYNTYEIETDPVSNQAFGLYF